MSDKKDVDTKIDPVQTTVPTDVPQNPPVSVDPNAGLTVQDFDANYYQEKAKTNEASAAFLPLLKINYQSKSKVCKKGEWVLGQKLKSVLVNGKSEDTIDEEGVKVERVTILKVRNQFSYFDKNNKANGCRSIVHKSFEKVKGNNYGYTCGNACPYRERTLKNRCSAQILVYAQALVGDKWLDCIMYLHGVAYMPFKGFYDSLLKGIPVNGVVVKLPIYALVTKLESYLDSKGAVDYFVPVFKIESLLKPEMVDKFESKLQGVEDYITLQNSMIDKTPAENPDDAEEDDDCEEEDLEGDSRIVDEQGEELDNGRLSKMLEDEVK